MAEKKLFDPVSGAEVPKVDNAVAIGEDLRFQERWWTFEKVIWSFFALILLLDVLGVFGSGWFANARLEVPGSGMLVDYERVERRATPSSLDVHFAPDAVQNGTVQLFVSDTLIKQLGTQRVAPQPRESVIGNGGITYTFPATSIPAQVQFGLLPGRAGVEGFTLQVPGRSAVGARVVVVP